MILNTFRGTNFIKRQNLSWIFLRFFTEILNHNYPVVYSLILIKITHYPNIQDKFVMCVNIFYRIGSWYWNQKTRTIFPSVFASRKNIRIRITSTTKIRFVSWMLILLFHRFLNWGKGWDRYFMLAIFIITPS